MLAFKSTTALPCASSKPRRSSLAARASSQPDAPKTCQTCGIELSKAPKGCDTQGRVMGGLGAVPGFGWWPIKAYRPCSALNEAGIEYTRKGQITNDVLFGGVSLGSAASTLDAMKAKAAEQAEGSQQQQ